MDTHIEELISAYLDGELTAAERQQVEQLLADNSEARDLLAELKALRADIKSLPRHRLEADFSERVLRQIAEKADAPSAGKANPLRSAPASLPPQESDRSSERGIRRALLWSSLAVAAAVLIMVFSGRPPDATLARKEDKARSSAAVDATEKKDRLTAKEETRVADRLEIGAAVADREGGRQNEHEVEDLAIPLQAGRPREERAQEALAPQIATPADTPALPTKGLAAAAEFEARPSFGQPLTEAEKPADWADRSVPSAKAGLSLADARRVAGPASPPPTSRPPASPARSLLERKSAAPLATTTSSDHDGIALFRSTGQASPADVDAFVRRHFKAKRVPANESSQLAVEFYLQKSGAQVAGVKRAESERVSDAVEIVYEMEGTGEQILATLAGLQTLPATIQFISTPNRRLDKMLANLPARAGQDAGLDLADQLAEADPQAAAQVKSRYKEAAAAAGEGGPLVWEKKTEIDELEEAAAAPTDDGTPPKSAPAFGQRKSAPQVTAPPDSDHRIPPAAAADEQFADGERDGAASGGEEDGEEESWRKNQGSQSTRQAGRVHVERDRGDIQRRGLSATARHPAVKGADIQPLQQDIAARGDETLRPAVKKAKAVDRFDAPLPRPAGQLAKDKTFAPARQYKILLVFRLDNTAGREDGDKPTARQGLADELPAAAEAEPAEADVEK